MKFIQENVLIISELAKQRLKAFNRLEEYKALKASQEEIPD
jgi:hypothetical protein